MANNSSRLGVSRSITALSNMIDKDLQFLSLTSPVRTRTTRTLSKPNPFFHDLSTTLELSTSFADPLSQKVDAHQSFREMGTCSLYGDEHANAFESGSRRTNGEVGTGLIEASSAPPVFKLPVGSNVIIRNKVGLTSSWDGQTCPRPKHGKTPLLGLVQGPSQCSF